MNSTNTKENNYYFPEKSHWEKYKLYYLVFGSFFLIILIILISNLDTNSQIKKVNKRLDETDFEHRRNPNDNPKPPRRRRHDHEGGDFIFPSDDQRNESWLTENVFQNKVRDEFKTWVNSVKYLPSYRIGRPQEPERHALFYGPPGSGKSHLAQKFAENEGLAYIFANFGFKLYAGSNQVAIDSAMDQAESLLEEYEDAKPVVFIIDEIDSIGKKYSNSHTSKQEVDALLTMIDKIKQKSLNIIVIGITNNPEELDPALKRAGRLGRQVEVPYLSREEIASMVKFLEKDMKGEKSGAYKYEGNKSKWKDKDKDKDKKIEWTNNFWDEVLQITFTAFEKCKQEGVGISYSDLELSVKDALAKELTKDSKKITPKVASFKEEMDKRVEDKIRDKPKPFPFPPQPQPEPVPRPKPDN